MRSPRSAPAADPFAPEGVDFQPVSPRLITARLLGGGLVNAVLVAVGITLGVLVSPWFHIMTGAGTALMAVELWFIPRQVRAMGYALTEDHLLWRQGVMFRSVSVIPYGRMQFVDTSQGPLAARLGIAEVKLHTASAGTDATIDGLPVDQAEHLRQVLSQRGEERMAGL
ncbi:PH domain-containing protein [Actinomyces bowdenii]|uniref:PH domain-containing protein n=1 Tax=Actinomyces bowdenii TaxID=131109 RepID=UPI001ABBF5AF|nr:PH domain-containing protein [Actinomyces bowdenii]MBO3723695.1 PH domain-containing protein [Actinomyces bowdenii]